MPPRKRTRAELEAPEPIPEKKEPSLLQRIRDMWEFSATMQFIYMFGKVVKIDEDFDVEDFEEECLKPGYSEKLEEIGLTLLKWISSHRGLTYDIWDEYVKRQYAAKAPNQLNPYGDEEEPKKFRNFDIFQKIRILHQLTVWTMWNPDRIRERMLEHQKEAEQTEWRMEPFGWDSEEREYYVLDDNRMYRRTDPPLPPAPKAKSKSNTIKARAARRRASKRRKLDEENESDVPDEDDASQVDVSQIEEKADSENDTFGGYKWECIAISLNDFNEFLDSIKKTKDANEKELRKRIIEDVLPVIEAAAEKQRRKQERRERELMLMEKMAGAKRSSRLADKHERDKKEKEEAEAARKKADDLAAAHREQEKQQQMEEDRKSRMMTREQRIKDREYKRLLMEEQIARDEEEAKRIEEGEKRGSERYIKDRMEKNKKELEELDLEEDWTFDCSGCGKHGKNYDDGAHSVACERCNVWQHSKCLGISKSAAEKDDFHFVCNDCRKKEEEAKRPKIMLKFGPNAQSSSPPQPPQSPVRQHQQAPIRFVSVDIPQASTAAVQPHGSPMNGLQVTQSPIARPPVPSPNSQMRPVSPTISRNGPSLQQPRQVPIHPSSPPPQMATGPYIPRPPQHQQMSNGSSFSQFQTPQAPSFGNPVAHQQQSYQGQNPSGQVQYTPRPGSGHEQVNGPTPLPRRIPSPVINRPTMSPTQGNPEVGPIAGVPGSSPSSYHPALFTPNANGISSRPSSQDQQTNGQHRHPSSSPRQSFTSQSPNPQHLSGLSPVKQRVTSPLPPPSNIPEKNLSTGISSSFNSGGGNSFNGNMNSTVRSISGTPIFPPAEKLAPSPEHIHREPVPTPTKQPSPILVDGEFRRISSIGTPMQGVHMNGNGNTNGQQPHNQQVVRDGSRDQQS